MSPDEHGRCVAGSQSRGTTDRRSLARVNPAVSATRGAPRVLRGVTLAGCSAALTVAAHTAAGGSAPSTGLTLVLTMLLAGLGVALADRRRGFPVILVVVGTSQLGMHVLLSGPLYGTGYGPGHGPESGHGHDVTVAGGMVALHAVAAVLTAVMLAGAESAVFATVAVLGWALRTVAVVPRPLPVLGPRLSFMPPAWMPGCLAIEVLLRRVHARRGPPNPR
jgi:hypothetical protein